MKFLFQVLGFWVLSSVILAACSKDVDDLNNQIDNLAEGISEAFTPSFNPPNNFFDGSIIRIQEIRPLPLEVPDTPLGTIFEYNSDDPFSEAKQIKYIWDLNGCDSTLMLLDWSEKTFVSDVFTGVAPASFDISNEEDHVQFRLIADKWILEHDMEGRLLKSYLENEPETYRKFIYRETNDFYDTILEYRLGTLFKTLDYQYDQNSNELLGVLELNELGDTIASYSYVPDYDADYIMDSFEASRLIAVPGTTCRFTYLQGPLWIWHFPYPVKSLYKDGVLVYEATYYYDISDYPFMVDYLRLNENSELIEYSEEILSEKIDR